MRSKAEVTKNIILFQWVQRHIPDCVIRLHRAQAAVVESIHDKAFSLHQRSQDIQSAYEHGSEDIASLMHFGYAIGCACMHSDDAGMASVAMRTSHSGEIDLSGSRRLVAAAPVLFAHIVVTITKNSTSATTTYHIIKVLAKY